MKASKDWKNVLRYLAFAIAFLLAGSLLILGGKRLWAQPHMEAGQLFCLSEREVRSISLTDRRTGERTTFHDPDTVAFVVQTLNDYRYSYVFRFDRERVSAFHQQIRKIGQLSVCRRWLFSRRSLVRRRYHCPVQPCRAVGIGVEHGK